VGTARDIIESLTGGKILKLMEGEVEGLCLADVTSPAEIEIRVRVSGPVMKTAIYDAFIAYIYNIFHDKISE